MLDLFVRHAATVQAALPAARLLVYDVRQGWQSLCAFLGVAVPARAFPHANARADYRQKFLR